MDQQTSDIKSPVLLIFDTETTGLPSRKRKIRTDPLSWPRLVEIGWILCHDNGEIIDEESWIIRPAGFEIPETAFRIHGITTEIAMKEGMPVDEVLQNFCNAATRADILIAHHLAFDIRIILSELIRSKKREMLPEIPGICTMRSSARYYGIPGRFGKGFKYPSLPDLHFRLLNTKPPDAHHALADARACAACYYELQRIGVKMEIETRINRFFRTSKISSI